MKNARLIQDIETADMIFCTFSRIRFVFMCVLLTLLVGCTKTYSWNQKLTVTLMTPTGEISASSVTEVTLVETSGKFVPPEARGVKSDLRGEAVVLEVTPGKYLFVLLDGVEQLVRSAFPQFPYERSSEFRRWAKQIEKHRGGGVVPPENYPLIVTFGDIRDPKSVELVDPGGLSELLGEGYRLESMELEITDAQVTSGDPSTRTLYSKIESQATFSGMNRFDEAHPEPEKYFTIKSLKRD